MQQIYIFFTFKHKERAAAYKSKPPWRPAFVWVSFICFCTCSRILSCSAPSISFGNLSRARRSEVSSCASENWLSRCTSTLASVSSGAAALCVAYLSVAWKGGNSSVLQEMFYSRLLSSGTFMPPSVRAALWAVWRSITGIISRRSAGGFLKVLRFSLTQFLGFELLQVALQCGKHQGGCAQNEILGYDLFSRERL